MTFYVRPVRGASSHATRTPRTALPLAAGRRGMPDRRHPAGFAVPPSPSPSPALRRSRGRVLWVVAGLSAVLLMPALVACSSEVTPDGTAAAPVPTAADTSAPAVTNATNLDAAPVIAAGEGEAPEDLVVRDLVVGTGTSATSSSTVLVHYVGVLWKDGKTFDSSRESGTGQPLVFPLDQVIPGFAQGIEGMKVGGRRELVIPPHLGYGPQGGSPPVIAADDTLVFVVDLVAVQGADAGAGTGEEGGGAGTGTATPQP